MAVRQLHYTSCEDGLEGIQGFQVSAMTPGTPKQLVDLAVRVSAYEPGPGLLDRLGDGDLSTFPIAFGYVPSGRGAALFQSCYAGADFTGRMGNYFAHAFLVEDAERELGDVLPIDLWASPVWTRGRQGSSALPEVTSLPPGTAITAQSARRFVLQQGGAAALERLISAVQDVLGAGRGRLVLVVPDDRSAALWIAAVCRSLPRELSLLVSFVTYTARPEEAGVLVSCTTPDVRIPTYGDFTVIDLTTGAPADTVVSRYASTVGRLWERDEVQTALRLASRVDPPLAPRELDAFAVLLEMAFGISSTSPPDERVLLEALRMSVERIAEPFPERAWARVADHVQDVGLREPAAWAEVLRSAVQRNEPVPSKLLGAYFVATLAAPSGLWTPRLSPADLEDVAENVVLPSLTGQPGTAVGERFSGHRDLFDALVRVLDRKLVDQRETRRLAEVLPVPAARLLQRTGSRRVGLLVDLVLARNGQLDPVKVMAGAVRDQSIEWHVLGPVLWPRDPSTEEALRLLKTVPAPVLTDSGLGTRIIARAMEESGRDDLGSAENDLIEELFRSPIAKHLAREDQAGLQVAQKITHFRRASPTRGAGATVVDGIETAVAQSGDAGRRLLSSIASFVLRADPSMHGELLDLALERHPAAFLPVYRDAARAELATSPPSHVAAVIVTWKALDNRTTRDRLLNETLASALRKRRRKHLDRIGGLLKPTADKLGVTAPRPGWREWWQTWRSRHERRGLLSMFQLRRR